ncbi:hypothetical protein DITRI_Ditri16bG0153300 [Diplodiscus trichospermus]
MKKAVQIYLFTRALPEIDHVLSLNHDYDMLVSWNCKSISEDDFTMFRWSYSKAIWKEILLFSSLHRGVGSWTKEFQGAIQKLKGKALLSIILRLAWKAFICHIWQERNSRQFKHSSEDPRQVLGHIKEVICLKLSGERRIAADTINQLSIQRWGLISNLLA